MSADCSAHYTQTGKGIQLFTCREPVLTLDAGIEYDGARSGGAAGRTVWRHIAAHAHRTGNPWIKQARTEGLKHLIGATAR
jgi:hypothetical protein